MYKQRLLVAQRQMVEIQDRKNINLQTDETPKFGEKYCSYIISDKDGNSYLFGIGHMGHKSAQTTLDRLKEIVSHLSAICSGSENAGQKLLCNIASTMSDRETTDIKFDYILEEYRKEFLPMYKVRFSDLTPDQQKVVSEHHNFFCGLHLLVGNGHGRYCVCSLKNP